MNSSEYFRNTIGYLAVFLLMYAVDANAQLAECDQIDENDQIVEAGACIDKSLSDQIGAGHGDELTPGSAVYLIKRDPARSIRRGRQLFQRKFTAYEGSGPRVNFTSMGDITETRALGAGLADSCAACHGAHAVPQDMAEMSQHFRIVGMPRICLGSDS